MLPNAIDDLAAYTRQRFTFEERLMLDAKYADYARHKEAHRALIEQLKQVAMPIQEPAHGEAHTTLAVPEEARDAMFGLLRHWLVDHIIKEELHLKSVL